MKNNNVLLAEVLRKLRIYMGYSKRSLAEAVGISHTELTRIENGNRKNYNLITLIRMCDLLHIDFVLLLKYTGYLPIKRASNDEKLIRDFKSYLNDIDGLDYMQEEMSKYHDDEIIRISVYGKIDEDEFKDLL